MLVPAAIAINLDSLGSILSSQERSGLYGRTFRIWKFRLMVENAEQLKTQLTNEVLD